MVYGLTAVDALARVCYHAQELSLLTASTPIHIGELEQVKHDLDQAYKDLLYPPQENHEPN